MRETKFILTLSNDSVPVLAEVCALRVLESDEKVIGKACVQVNVKNGIFKDITRADIFTDGTVATPNLINGLTSQDIENGSRPSYLTTTKKTYTNKNNNRRNRSGY